MAELPDALTLGDALRQLDEHFPALAPECLQKGPGGPQLAPQCIASLGGHRFVRDPSTRLEAGEVLLILSADAGG